MIHGIDYNKEDLSPCIEWHKCTDTNGYGLAYSKHNKKVWKAHRLAWFKANGEITKGKIICHKCDNRKCINLEHLFMDSQKENVRDAYAKGRMQDNSRKLDKKWHAYIVKARAAGMTTKRLANIFDITKATINLIVKNSGAVVPEHRGRQNRKLDKKWHAYIVKARAAGMTTKRLANIFDITEKNDPENRQNRINFK